MAVAVIIAPRADLRGSFEQLFRDLPRYGGIASFSALADARSALQREGGADMIFISEDFGADAVAEFIEFFHNLPFGRKSTFVTVLRFGSADAERIAECLARGSHGVLREPISMTGLEEVIELSRSVRHQGTKIRLKTAAALFVASAVDRMTREQGIPTEKKDLMTKVRDACRDYKRLTGTSLTLDAISPERKNLKEYTGISRRVREIYELRLKSLIGKMFHAPERTPSGRLKTVK